jgi:4-amino-4-deoxy-L-arabinose transferase-like glycosyltransferase
MLNRFISLGCMIVIAMGIVLVPFPEGAAAIAMVMAVSAAFIFAFRRYTEEKEFITTVFLVALALRMAFGLFIHIYELREFFGGDAFSYDAKAAQMVENWMGLSINPDQSFFEFDPRSGIAWGMYYLTAVIYYIFGRNIFAAQSFCAVLGAATAPMVYFCTRNIYSNRNASRIAAIAIAVFPSFIIWSGQLLKDGLIIFLLVVTMTMVLELQKKLRYPAVAILVLAMFGILSLRFYIFYMVIVAVVGSFVVGVSSSQRSMIRSTIILFAIGLGLAYLGVGQRASVELTTFTSLDRIQGSRSDLARAAETGFGEDLDVSTAEGALSALPIGFSYLMFAPFPWQAANLRQAITIPEVLVWWGVIPFLLVGLVYTIRHRLRNAFPILMFSLMLTIAYSIFQGNVGTAYRQRTQIQVFLFILVAVGWTVFKENRENKRLIQADAQRRVEEQIRANALGRPNVEAHSTPAERVQL